MADSVELPIDLTSWDKLHAAVESTTKASKELGETWKRAFLGEIVVNGIQRVGAALGGVAGEATNAAGAILQGFFAGGPVGAAIAATGASVGFLVNRFQELEKAGAAAALASRRSWALAAIEVEQRAAAFRSAAAQEDAERLARQLDREAAARDAATAANDAWVAKNKAKGEEVMAYLREQDEALRSAQSTAALQADQDALQAFQDELDIEAEQAFARRQAKDAEAATERDRQRARDAEEIRLYNLKNAQVEEAERRLHAQVLADKIAADEAEAAVDAARVARVSSDYAALGATLSNGFAGNVGSAVRALASLDAAQIAAAASSEDLGANLAESALKSIQGVLAAVAQQAAVKAALYTAEGVGALAGVATAPLAPGLFAAAAGFAGVAALAGGAAIGAGTLASAVAPPRPAPQAAPTTTRNAPVGTATGASGGTVVININSSALVTQADVGAGVDRALRARRRYAGTR